MGNRTRRTLVGVMRDEDELWREIVDNYGDRATLDGPSDEAAEPTTLPDPALEPEPGDLSDPEPPDPVELRDTWGDEGRFVPEEPPRVPLPAPPRLVAWTGVFGMPVLLLVIVITGQWLPSWMGLGMAAWFVGGFVYLVKNMPDEPRDPWDNGARL
ncbi:MAG: hypothetical protein L0H93_06340 [Nocardioides sp.]|nr:hypothetical protein [Nocardioides sp.]